MNSWFPYGSSTINTYKIWDERDIPQNLLDIFTLCSNTFKEVTNNDFTYESGVYLTDRGEYFDDPDYPSINFDIFKNGSYPLALSIYEGGIEFGVYYRPVEEGVSINDLNFNNELYKIFKFYLTSGLSIKVKKFTGTVTYIFDNNSKMSYSGLDGFGLDPKVKGVTKSFPAYSSRDTND